METDITFSTNEKNAIIAKLIDYNKTYTGGALVSEDEIQSKINTLSSIMEKMNIVNAGFMDNTPSIIDAINNSSYKPEEKRSMIESVSIEVQLRNLINRNLDDISFFSCLLTEIADV
ncbi:hypothetical protein SAMN05444405_10492 [Bacteroides luti]|uniref:Uncharacterized protein n=1 Tax=Bacteroides luti TaxID=1297750 RepID=A0A1M4XPN2_9BACE|nr:hypothetical protein [Bacteroides luti]SHE95390.1 hypothetical protein SAMN05444405_10492 [Bacteroides luti]